LFELEETVISISKLLAVAFFEGYSPSNFIVPV
jgi:hypothetical protein